MLKSCRDCGGIYPVADFPPYSGGRGKRPMCKPCFNIAQAAKRQQRRKADPSFYERELERNKAYRDRYSNGYVQHRLNKRENERSRYFSDLMYRCKQLARGCQTRAARKGFDCDITGEIIFVKLHEQSFKCIKTGVGLEISASDKYSRNPFAPSIDRINNSLGYTVNNIQLVSAWYNMLKNEWSDTDVRHFVFTAYHSMFKD